MSEMNEEVKLELERKTRFKENLEREIEMFEKQKPEVQQRYNIHKEMVSILKQNHMVMMDNFVFNKPTWKYEELPEYIDNIKRLNTLNFEKASLDWDNQSAQFENTLRSIDEQLFTARENLTRVIVEIEKLKGDTNGAEN